ncbi:glycosyltransferase [Pseudoxanthomonas yeongjuensis]|uniref:glycosyltransferase n=1 Tax=Pseudoxanthomonas yeongjuensis TaxID=377616 RepID=UPI0013907535|nr:glycosyltransferase [Pseudoxanthomonas yeongjuensis]
MFDAVWYVNKYPDVASLSIEPAEHYLRYGARLLRDPGPNFSTRRYLSENSGVDFATSNPLLHYLESSSRNGALPQPAPALVGSTKIGYFDRFSESMISGWAIDPARPGQAVELEIKIDEEPLCRIKTGLPRADVSAAGLDGSVAGFSLSFPPGLFPDGTKIDVTFLTDAVSLRRSPRIANAAVQISPGGHGRFMDAVRQKYVRPITIIVPIFNAHEAVAECLPAAIECLGEKVELLLIDDASTEQEIGNLLNHYGDFPYVHVYRNETNLGYTRTVNRGLSLCEGRDVVLLNSDTVVTGHWLSSLRYCAYAFGKVATVTALSNNAGAFSAPEPTGADWLPDAAERQSCAHAIVQAGAGREIAVPTGNGFCLYIRRDALEEIGVFDEIKFPRGYGEENEFCMRGQRKGWRHLVSDKAYVFHKRSQSFLGEKAELIAQASRALNSEFPEYKRLVARFNDLEFCMIRKRAKAAIYRAEQGARRKRILYVISTQTGGTPQTNMDLMREISSSHDCLLLCCDTVTVKLFRLVDDKLLEIETQHMHSQIDPLRHTSSQYDNYVADLLYRHSIDILHIRHIAWHSLGLIEAAKELSVPIVYSIHDFYTACPTVKLLDQDAKFCGGVCTAGKGECRVELWRQEEIPNLKHRFIERWRELQSSHFDAVGAFVTTSAFVADLFVNIFPSVSRDKFYVIPHGRDFPRFISAKVPSRQIEKLRVVVLGNIGAAKGSSLLRAMSGKDREGILELHFLGNMAAELTGIGIHHGKYSRENVVQKIEEIDPHVGVIFSIWPETFCHTLTELWASGIPVLGMDIGAVGERIAASGAGWLIAHDASADEALGKLMEIRGDLPAYEQAVAAVNAWQQTEGVSNSCAMMAERYLHVYKSVSNSGCAAN